MCPLRPDDTLDIDLDDTPVANDTLDFDMDAPVEATAPADPVPGRFTPSPIPDAPADREGSPALAPVAASDPPGQKKAPSASGKRGGRSKLLSASNTGFNFDKYVNLHRDRRAWVLAAIAADEAGRVIDFGPERRTHAASLEFGRLINRCLCVRHPTISAVANVYLRRRDLPGLRRAMREIIRREVTGAALLISGHNPQRLFRHAQRN